MKLKFRFFLALSLLFSFWTLSSPAEPAVADQAPVVMEAAGNTPASEPANLAKGPTLADVAAAERMSQPAAVRAERPDAFRNVAPVYLPVILTTQQQQRAGMAPPTGAQPDLKLAALLVEEERFLQVDPQLAAFIGAVQDPGKQGQAVGLYAPGVMAIKIVQQPASNPVYVSTGPEEATQFRLAKKSGVLGLLAHNYLAGQYFFELETGAELFVIRGDGSYQVYEVYAVEDYQALTVTTFRSLADRKFFDQYALYDRVYRSDNDRLVLQTCLAKGGNLSWGRRFVLAKLVSGSN